MPANKILSDILRGVSFLLLLLALLGMQSVYTHTHSTNFFRIRYEKNVSLKDAQAAGRMLEDAYENVRKKLNLSLSHRVDVSLYDSGDRLVAETHTKFFDNGLFNDGKIYLRAQRKNEADMKDVAVRVVSRAVLDQHKACPAWLAEAYSLYAGGDTTRFGQPSHSNLSTFSDLAEDFARTEQQKEVYAELTATMTFLVNRYGEPKIDGVFARFETGAPLEEIFESAFGEKIDVIQKAWSAALTPAAKK